jgi:hypothetical protein
VPDVESPDRWGYRARPPTRSTGRMTFSKSRQPRPTGASGCSSTRRQQASRSTAPAHEAGLTWSGVDATLREMGREAAEARDHRICAATRRLPGHPCESDGSGSAGRRRASLCALRPSLSARIRAGQRFGVAARIDRSRAGRTAGARRCPQSSPHPGCATTGGASRRAWRHRLLPRLGPARTHQVCQPDRDDGGVALVLVTARSPAQSAGRAGRELQRAGVGPTRRPGLRTPGCPPSPQSCHQDGTAAWS